MRTAFIERLSALAKVDKNLWLLTGDLGFSVFEDFMSKFPHQFLNVGVAEQNMIGISAGLAFCGKKVFVYSIVPFVTMRCFEQVHDDICLQNANVKLVGVGEGFSYGQLGPTHHSIEDIAIFRSLPNMVVVCPGDPWEVGQATNALSKIKNPAYLRIGKKGEPKLHDRKAKFVLGRGIVMNDDRDLTIIATGSMLETAVMVTQELRDKGLGARLISMHTVKPLDVQLVIASAFKTGAMFTVEEHSVIGGLGSAVAQVLTENRVNCIFHAFGVADKFTKFAGSQDYLRGLNGLSVKEIVRVISKLKND